MTASAGSWVRTIEPPVWPVRRARAAATIASDGSYPGGVATRSSKPASAGRLDQRVADVVAVADEGDLDPGQRPELLLEGQDVGQRLARVVLVRSGR